LHVKGKITRVRERSALGHNSKACIMPARNTRTCPAVVPLCGTKAEVTVPSLDDWEKEWERAENVKSGKLKCATKVAAGGFPVAVGWHCANELRRRIDANTKPFLANKSLLLWVDTMCCAT
jgi:hypothetical protein